MIWAVLTFILVGLTKYLTSLRLRNLRDKVQSDQRDADDLRKQLSEVVEKETVLKDETEKLMDKANTLHNIVVNLERSMERAEQA
jgi:regulator of replication initiation timing